MWWAEGAKGEEVLTLCCSLWSTSTDTDTEHDMNTGTHVDTCNVQNIRRWTPVVWTSCRCRCQCRVRVRVGHPDTAKGWDVRTSLVAVLSELASPHKHSPHRNYASKWLSNSIEIKIECYWFLYVGWYVKGATTIAVKLNSRMPTNLNSWYIYPSPRKAWCGCG